MWTPLADFSSTSCHFCTNDEITDNSQLKKKRRKHFRQTPLRWIILGITRRKNTIGLINLFKKIKKKKKKSPANQHPATTRCPGVWRQLTGWCRWRWRPAVSAAPIGPGRGRSGTWRPRCRESCCPHRSQTGWAQTSRACSKGKEPPFNHHSHFLFKS